MQVKLFSIPAFGASDVLDELNTFLRSNRVLEIKKEFVAGTMGEYWAFCITYLPNNNPLPSSSSGDRREKIDYRALLSDAEFERFSLLRKIRKQVADDDAVPPYAVFTDAEIAELSHNEELTVPVMKNVAGIGKKKIEKYGAIVCDLYNRQFCNNLNEEDRAFEG